MIQTPSDPPPASPDRRHLVVALTGAIGSGKSAVAERLERCGAFVIDADILARRVVEPGTPALRQIVEHFGSTIVHKGGVLDRKKLGEIVFNSPPERRWLEGCLHPRIRERFEAELAAHLMTLPSPPPVGTRHLVIYVVPLLFESPTPRTEFDYTVVVSANREISRQRVVARDRCTAELAERKLAAQLPIEQKVALADYTIKNEGSLEELDRAVASLYATLTTLPPRASTPTNPAALS